MRRDADHLRLNPLVHFCKSSSILRELGIVVVELYDVSERPAYPLAGSAKFRVLSRARTELTCANIERDIRHAIESHEPRAIEFGSCRPVQALRVRADAR